MLYYLRLYSYCIFFFSCSGDHRDLHSFPTRRSSDLVGAELLQHLRRNALALADQPEQDVLGADVVVTELQRSEEHTSELQSRRDLVCRLLLEKKKNNNSTQLQLNHGNQSSSNTTSSY